MKPHYYLSITLFIISSSCSNKTEKKTNPIEVIEETKSVTFFWKKEEREQVYKSCLNNVEKGGMDKNVAKEYCNCTIETLEKKYKTANDATKATLSEIQSIANQCLHR